VFLGKTLFSCSQAFSQDSKGGHPKGTIGLTQMNVSKIKQFSLKSGGPQDTWTPYWLKSSACGASFHPGV